MMNAVHLGFLAKFENKRLLYLSRVSVIFGLIWVEIERKIIINGLATQ